MGFCFISEVFLPYITNTKDIDFFCIGKNKVKKTKTGIIYLKNKILSRQEKYCISVLKEKIINGEIGHSMKLYPYFLLALVKTVTDNYNKINVMSQVTSYKRRMRGF